MDSPFWDIHLGEQFHYLELSGRAAPISPHASVVVVIDNDGVHRAAAVSASATLTRGCDDIKVDYFQDAGIGGRAAWRDLADSQYERLQAT